ncbi:MAG: hypothetical protein J5666_07120 [Bacilli bacterium]|nr:hypothetical protein [Bacilli bacterium]
MADEKETLDLNNESIDQVDNSELPLVERQTKEEIKALKLKKLEKRKLRVIRKLIAGEINGTEAAKKLKITTRQVRNLKRQVLDTGAEGVIHKNRYHKPINTYEEQIRKEIAHIYRVEFRGTNFTNFAIEMQNRGYNMSRSTIYNILRQEHIRSPQRKKHKRKKIEK